jgi:hypothetical protein
MMKKTGFMRLFHFAPAVLVGLIAWQCEGNGTVKTDDAMQEQDSLQEECGKPFDPLNPGLRMVYVDFQAPVSLDNPVIEAFVNEAFMAEDCLWLFQFTGVDDGSTDTDGKLHVLTGAGDKVPGTTGCYTFADDSRCPLAELDMHGSGDDVSGPADGTSIDMTIPLYISNPETGSRDLVAVFPMKRFSIESGRFASNRAYAGTEAEFGGVLTGLITVEDARKVIIEQVGCTLCGLLSGDKGRDLGDPDDDCLQDKHEWIQQPDAEYKGQSAFEVRACFSAAGISII